MISVPISEDSRMGTSYTGLSSVQGRLKYSSLLTVPLIVMVTRAATSDPEVCTELFHGGFFFFFLKENSIVGRP